MRHSYMLECLHTLADSKFVLATPTNTHNMGMAEFMHFKRGRTIPNTPNYALSRKKED